MLLQIIRIATVACYFLTFTFLFVTCGGNNSKTLFDFAYNKKDAAENAIKDEDNCFGCTGGVASAASDTASNAIPVRDSSTGEKT